MAIPTGPLNFDPKSHNIRRALVRRQMLRGRLAPIVYSAIEKRYQSEDVRERLLPFCSSSMNVAKQVAEKVVTVYRHNPMRTRGDGPQDAFWSLLRESRLPQLAGGIAREAWFAGPVFVMPLVAPDGTMHLKRWGAGLTTVVYSGYSVERFMGVDAVDEQGSPLEWWYADRDVVGHFVRKGNSAEQVALYEHGVGRTPVVEWRAHPMEPDDPLGLDFGDSLQDATVEAGVAYTALQYTRKAQHFKLPMSKARKFGPDEAHLTTGPPQQAMDPEGGIRLGEDEALEIADFDLNPDNAIRQMTFTISTTLQHYGLELAAPLNVSLQVEISLASTQAHRAEIMQWAQPADEATCDLIVDVARASGHASAAAIVDAATNVQFPEIALVADPVRREELYERQAARGGTNPVEAYMLDHPGVSAAEAEGAIRRNIDLTTEITSRLADRRALSPDNVERGAVVFESDSQQNGRIGGQMGAN